MKVGFYDVVALAVGVPLAVLMFSILGSLTKGQGAPEWVVWYWAACMCLASWITARCFRSTIVKRWGIWEHLIAVALGFLGAEIFAFLAVPGVGAILALGLLFRFSLILAPTGLVYFYFMRWADRNDRNSLAMKEEARLAQAY
ncbi:MAG: hypothetical protein BGO01_12840 [Armatimonadetes bacterium 55-13]|nr:hypothetical protein [Armatimonadota bacterium]OJU61796.1 MAG: hypothetical protein BGO01_12840 [Armatimonadetes bacterium 55-13]